ncbi:hypothetical protein KZ820_17795 [Sphingomonas sp. RRHST34]|uniref:DUF4198 domain-containing protein n=1 Tax=Sphingomonas citri TaxID=2862499 RepID=A0ABS7BSQ0_9SPHN|nr:hypothetical protein [Sphingomonas citri]MBW6532598.1 hypothetical protein [Sphingomonas citri]
MGLDDRDYMRERYRKRQGLDQGETTWNDKKARREQSSAGYKKAVPLGSASWISKPIKTKSSGSGGGAWFAAKNRGFDYQKGRFRPPPPLFKPHPLQGLVLLLSAVGILIPAYREAKRAGWFPDRTPEIAFPATGTVTVSNDVNPRSATSRMTVATDQANAVVQLFKPETDAHVISVYVHRNDDVTVPVPPGTYRMKIIEGDKWHGTTSYFGPSTTYETVVRPMVFTRRRGAGIDLHRSPAGTLHTSINIKDPKPLN